MFKRHDVADLEFEDVVCCERNRVEDDRKFHCYLVEGIFEGALPLHGVL